MYDRQTYNGDELNAEYAARRMANEPLSEIFQVNIEKASYSNDVGAIDLTTVKILKWGIAI